MVRRWMSAMAAMLLLLGSVKPVAAATSSIQQPPAPQAESGTPADPNPPASPESNEEGTPQEPTEQEPTTPVPVPQEPTPETPAPQEPAPEEPAPLFTDLPTSHWAYPPVERLVQAGIVAASPEGIFRPADPVTRAELAKLILAARQIDPAGSCWGIFPDVNCKAWYADEVEYAYRLAFLEPSPDGLFHPNAPVTREEMVKAIVASIGQRWQVAQRPRAEINAILAPFKDWRQIDWYAAPAYAYAVGEGLTVGFPDATLRPTGHATRAEAAVWVSRILLDAEGMESQKLDGHQVTFSKVVEMRASMYTPDEHDVGSVTYTGVTVRHGAIAVDPNVIPLGTLLYVEGYGYGVAVDIGGMIKGDRIDLFSWRSARDAMIYGIQPVKVWILP